MSKFRIKTTIDITKTDPDRECKDAVRIAQQANFNSLMQAIGMRANITWTDSPRTDDNMFWYWEFETEYQDVFMLDGDSTALLKQDISGVPIIKNLTNTDPLDKPMFITHGSDQNIWIEN